MQPYTRDSLGLGQPHGSPSARSASQRDPPFDRSSELEPVPYGGRMSGEGPAPRSSPAGERLLDDDKDFAKLKQISQRFFTKAALTIISSRVDLPQDFHRTSKQIRSNKWFNLILDESEQLVQELVEWASMDVTETRPNPLFIEIYLDTTDLARNQTLVVVDDRGTKWDVRKALDVASNTASGRKGGGKIKQIILERWQISIGEPATSTAFADSPPNVYKKAVVLFRALYSFLHLMPAWQLGRRIAKEPATLTSLRPMYRIVKGEPTGPDTLSMPLYPASEPAVETHVFPATRCPTGPLQLQVSYRTNCNFRLNDLDAVLSSHFVGIDEHYFRPSLNEDSSGDTPYWISNKDAGSLPSDRRYLKTVADAAQAYGSMSTFHNAGPGTGTSPLSALRAAGKMASGTPTDVEPQRIPPDHRTSQSFKSSLKGGDGPPTAERRVSISFQPFKAGSLSSSPGLTPVLMASPKSVGAGTSDISRALAQARNLSLPQAALRAPPTPTGEVGSASPSPGSTSVKPPTITRYSSSFGHRRSRFSSGSGGASRTEEDNSSSVRGSQSSSNQPGSGILAGGDSGNSSGSARTDEDNIADFLKMLDSKKGVAPFTQEEEPLREASTQRTNAALNKYQRMRESHSYLTDSLTSSMMLPRSSTSSSRGPPMLAGNSVSTSSSPGKAISPHTPHYPAIPSRLSANATVEDAESSDALDSTRSRRGRRSPSPTSEATTSRPRAHPSGSTPMDIPTSPQRYPLIRRSSSAAQRRGRRASEDLDEFGLRSASLQNEGRPDLSLSELLALQQHEGNLPTTTLRGGAVPILPGTRPIIGGVQESSSVESQTSARPPHSTSASGLSVVRSRFSRGGGRGSPSSLGGSGESSRAGRYNASGSGRPGTADDDEPLVFTMSEIGAQSRRIGEDGEGSSEAHTGRPDLAMQGRRGSRRGGTLW